MFVRWLTALLFSLYAVAGGAQGFVQVPALTGRVVDASAVLSSEQRQALEGKLAALETSSGSQVVILMVPSTLPEDIASFGNRVGNTWRIGRKGVGDGLLLIVATSDRKLRFEVASRWRALFRTLLPNRSLTKPFRPASSRGITPAGSMLAWIRLPLGLKVKPCQYRPKAVRAQAGPKPSTGRT